MRSDTRSVAIGVAPETIVDFVADRRRGTVDFRMEPAPGSEAVAYSRVVPNGAGAGVRLHPLPAPPGTPDEVFRQVAL